MVVCLDRLERALAAGLVALIRLYQKCISPALGPRCRFYPSCSEYSVVVLQKYGPVRGAMKSMMRVCKCHPFHRGGVDLP